LEELAELERLEAEESRACTEAEADAEAEAEAEVGRAQVAAEEELERKARDGLIVKEAKARNDAEAKATAVLAAADEQVRDARTDAAAEQPFRPNAATEVKEAAEKQSQREQERQREQVRIEQRVMHELERIEEAEAQAADERAADELAADERAADNRAADAQAAGELAQAVSKAQAAAIAARETEVEAARAQAETKEQNGLEEAVAHAAPAIETEIEVAAGHVGIGELLRTEEPRTSESKAGEAAGSDDDGEILAPKHAASSTDIATINAIEATTNMKPTVRKHPQLKKHNPLEAQSTRRQQQTQPRQQTPPKSAKTPRRAASKCFLSPSKTTASPARLKGVSIRLQRSGGKFGLKFKNASSVQTGPIICGVLRGSAADLSRAINNGDQIVAVNHFNCFGMLASDLKEILRDYDRVTLRVRKKWQYESRSQPVAGLTGYGATVLAV
jgi:hypothetical protein